MNLNMDEKREIRKVDPTRSMRAQRQPSDKSHHLTHSENPRTFRNAKVVSSTIIIRIHVLPNSSSSI